MQKFVDSTGAAQALRGPIVVLGAGGFVGANLFRRLLACRSDVFGVVFRQPNWRLQGLDPLSIVEVDINDPVALRGLLQTHKPATIFNCTSYGAYSFEGEANEIYRTNFIAITRLLELLDKEFLAAFIQAGSSSEYGHNSAGPSETTPLLPNSHYAVSKAATSHLISYWGRTRLLPT